MTIKEYALDRVKEPSTWRGAIMLIGALVGYHLDPNVSEAVITIIVSIGGSGLAGIVTKDK